MNAESCVAHPGVFHIVLLIEKPVRCKRFAVRMTIFAAIKAGWMLDTAVIVVLLRFLKRLERAESAACEYLLQPRSVSALC